MKGRIGLGAAFLAALPVLAFGGWALVRVVDRARTRPDWSGFRCDVEDFGSALAPVYDGSSTAPRTIAALAAGGDGVSVVFVRGDLDRAVAFTSRQRTSAHLRCALTALGDLDADGVTDLAFQAPGASVSLLSGADGALLRELTSEDASFGACVAPLAAAGFAVAAPASGYVELYRSLDVAPERLDVAGASLASDERYLAIGVPPDRIAIASLDRGGATIERWIDTRDTLAGTELARADAVLANELVLVDERLLVGAHAKERELGFWIVGLSWPDCTLDFAVRALEHVEGASLARGGDFDGDGADDVLVHACRAGADGAVALVSSRTGSLLARVRGAFDDFPHDVGCAAVAIGDHDGDALPDVLVTASAHFVRNIASELRVYSGASGAELDRFGFEDVR